MHRCSRQPGHEDLYKKYKTPKDFAYANPKRNWKKRFDHRLFPQQDEIHNGRKQRHHRKFRRRRSRTMEEILTLPGVARKTANVVLGTAYGIASGVVVDTHVIRISRRLDLTKHQDPKKIEQDLMEIIPQDNWIKFSHQLIWHGRRVCFARKPRCVDCNLEQLCYSKDKTV